GGVGDVGEVGLLSPQGLPHRQSGARGGLWALAEGARGASPDRASRRSFGLKFTGNRAREQCVACRWRYRLYGRAGEHKGVAMNDRLDLRVLIVEDVAVI